MLNNRDRTLEDWDKEFWQKNFIPFQNPEPNKFLVKFYDKLNVNPPGRFFIPLCGKTLDMIWLADKGHEVVGVECSEIAVKDFFKENNLAFTTNKIENFVIYKATGKDITIYHGDLFNAGKDVVGDFDHVLDIGSFVAINKSDRKRYAAQMNTLVKAGARYLLVSVFFEEEGYTGPGMPVTPESLELTLGKFFDYEQVDYFLWKNPPVDLEWIEKRCYVLKKKI